MEGIFCNSLLSISLPVIQCMTMYMTNKPRFDLYCETYCIVGCFVCVLLQPKQAGMLTVKISPGRFSCLVLNYGSLKDCDRSADSRWWRGTDGLCTARCRWSTARIAPSCPQTPPTRSGRETSRARMTAGPAHTHTHTDQIHTGATPTADNLCKQDLEFIKVTTAL